MEVGDIRFYKERWNAIKQLEHWGLAKRPFGFIERILIVLDITPSHEVDKMQIILRWAKLKELFEQGKLKHPSNLH